jgi:nucleoside-diphosphate-sugar epimerase
MEYLGNEVYRADVATAVRAAGQFEFFYGKKIVVLGASGLIGSFLVDCFCYANRTDDACIDILAVGRSRERLKDRFGEENRHLHFLESDITQLTHAGPADILIHAASLANPRAYRKYPVETMLGNFTGTQRCLDIARNNPGCRVLFVSSGEVYADMGNLSPRACYPVSKMAGETLCLSYIEEYGVDAVIARPCHTFGPNATAFDNRATAQFIGLASQNQDIVMNSDGSQLRSFAYVADCASGILAAIIRGETGHAYDVASDEVISIREFAETCAGIAGARVVRKEADAIARAEASPIPSQIMKNDKLKVLGWTPAFSLHDGVEHSIRIQREIYGF